MLWQLSIYENESEVAQSCLTLWDLMDCSLSGSSVYGIFQARVLEWVAISFCRGLSQTRNQTRGGQTLYRLSHQGSIYKGVYIAPPLWDKYRQTIARWFLPPIPLNGGQETCYGVDVRRPWAKRTCVTTAAASCQHVSHALWVSRRENVTDGGVSKAPKSSCPIAPCSHGLYPLVSFQHINKRA